MPSMLPLRDVYEDMTEVRRDAGSKNVQPAELESRRTVPKPMLPTGKGNSEVEGVRNCSLRTGDVLNGLSGEYA